MIANYKLAPSARDDLQRIWQYGLEVWGEDAADRYIEDLFGQFETIAKQPYVYQAVDHIRAGYRRCVVGHDSVYYRIAAEGVEVMAIIGRQDVSSRL